MRNFSKVLALVLALAMVMTMFAGAVSFTEKLGGYDDLSANGQAAADILTALGIAKGNAAKEINGSALVKRSEAAKLVYAAKTGDVEGQADYYNAASSFADVAANDWFANVITWAEANKILNGYGDGTVKPNNNVTGVEFAKMLLSAMGNNNKGELTGSAWKSNTLQLAGNLHITDGVAENLYGYITKEAAYIMTANALYANGMAMAKASFNLIDVNAVAVANANEGLGMLWSGKYADIVTGTGAVVNYAKAPAGYVTFAYRDYAAATSATGEYAIKVFQAKTSVADYELGTEYRVLATAAVNNYISSEYRTVYGIIGESTETFAKVVSDVGTKDLTKLTVATEANDGTKFVNGASVDKAALLAADVASTAPIYYYDNNSDGIYDTAHAYTYTLATVYAVAEDGKVSYTVGNVANAGKTLVVDNGETLAAGDYIALYNDTVQYAKKLTTVNGAITGYNGSYVIKGTAYGVSAIATDRAKNFLANANQYMINAAEYTFITDEDSDNHYIVDVLLNENTKYSEFALVADDVVAYTNAYGTSYYKPYVRLFTADNTFEIYTVASVDGVLPYANNAQVLAWGDAITKLTKGTLVSYTVVGNDVYLTTAKYMASQNADDNLIYNDTMAVGYNADIDMFVTTDSKAIFDTNAAVVFAKQAGDVNNANLWKAYEKGEFYLLASANHMPATFFGFKNTVYNAAYIAQALVVTADEVPATVFNGNGKIVLVKKGTAWTLETADGVYTHTVSTIPAMGETAETFTYKSYSPVNTLTTGAYVVTTDENGVLVDYQTIALGTGTSVANAIMTQAATINSYYKDAYGKIVLVINDGSASKATTFAADATIYSVKNLATAVEAVTFENLFNAQQGITSMTNVDIYCIYNAAGEISVAFINQK